MQRLSLRLRLAFLVAGTALPLIIFAAAIVFLNFETDRADAGKRLVEIARSMVIAVDRELEGRIAALEVLSQSQALADDDLIAFRSRAAVFLSRQPPAANLVLIARDGRQVLNMRVPPGKPLPVVTALDEVEEVFQTARPNVTNYRVGPVGRRPIITVDVPVFRDGKVVYVLSLNPTVELFAELIAKQRSEQDWVVAVFDGAGMVVARKPNPEQFVGRRASSTLYPALMASMEGLLDTTSLEGTVVFTAFSRSQTTGWSVAIGVPRATFTRPLWQSIAGTVAIGLALLVIGLAFAVSMATQMARAAAHRELLINELNHRVKNTLTTVQSIVGRTLRGGGPRRAEAVKTLEGRLMALSRTHNVLSAENWDSANLHDIANQALAPYAAGDRVHVEGPAVRLRPRASLTTALVLHELATNAAKYGALSNATGRVSLTWTIRAKDQGPTLRLLWRESGGPQVQQPGNRKGFGSTLINKGIAYELGGSAELKFEPPGVTCTIEFPLAATQSAESKTETVSSAE